MSAAYLLDSDICIYSLSRRFPGVTARFDRLRPGEALISAVAYGELLFGASKSNATAAAAAKLAALTSIARVSPLPLDAAEHYAQIRRHLEVAGTPIGSNGAWIAAHARVAGLILVTTNEHEFRRVPQLQVENWVGTRVSERAAAYRGRRRHQAADLEAATDVAPVDPVADVRWIMARLASRPG